MNKLSNEQATALIDDAYLRGMATKLASRRYPAKSQDDLIKAAHTATRLHQSGQVKVSKDGKLLQASIAGKPVEDDRDYTVATIDYLADGNDGMTAFLQADKRECPDGATLRGLFMKYVEKQTAAGKKVSSRWKDAAAILWA